MKWLLLSSATEIKVLNFCNHRQAKPARKHDAYCHLGRSGRRAGAQACGCTLVCVCVRNTFCCVTAGSQFWSNFTLQLFYRVVQYKRELGGCASRLCAVKTDWQALGAMGSAVEEPLGNGGEPSPLPDGGEPQCWMLRGILLLLLKGPLLSLLASLLFSGPPIPHGRNHAPPKSHASGTSFCHRRVATGPPPGTGPCQHEPRRWLCRWGWGGQRMGTQRNGVEKPWPGRNRRQGN